VPRAIAALLVIALVVMTLLWLSCAGDKPVLLVSNAAVQLCPKAENPCDKIDCDRQPKMEMS
jgi:hypothetical protein